MITYSPHSMDFELTGALTQLFPSWLTPWNKRSKWILQSGYRHLTYDALLTVSKGLIHLGWVRLGVPEDVVCWLQAMDEEALTIVRTPFALEIHNTAGLEGLWKASRFPGVASN